MEKLLAQLSADEGAQRLLGATIIRDVDGRQLKLKIVETESYDQNDEASHSFKRTARSEPMFGPAGRAYIYFIYGNHYCLNVVCGPDGFGSGALIRAAEPLGEFDYLKQKRGVDNLPAVSNGPGKLCQAISVDRGFIGHDLSQPPLQVVLNPQLPTGKIVQTTRIGISKAVHERRRYYIKGSNFISHC